MANEQENKYEERKNYLKNSITIYTSIYGTDYTREREYKDDELIWEQVTKI